jgi:hypothetical protein
MRTAIQSVWSELVETTTYREVMETEPNPGMMQSIEEHQEIPKEDVAVMPVGEPRRQHRVWNLATECHQKMKERTQGYRGSRRKLAATCRKMAQLAKVAWQKRNLIKNIQTLEKCGRQKEFATTRIRTTSYAKVERHKGRSDEGPLVKQGRWKTKTGIKLQEELE